MEKLNSKHLSESDAEPSLREDRITLFNMRFCPYAQRTVLVAIAKGISFDIVNINLSSKPDWYWAKNPLGKVPTIQNRDFVAFESIPLADYLEEKYPEPKLAPDTPEQKAKDAALVAVYENQVVFPLYTFYSEKEESVKETNWNKMQNGLKLVEAALEKRGQFFGGQSVKLIDYYIWPWFERIPALISRGAFKDSQFLEKFPLLSQWISRMEADPAVKKYRVPTDVHAKFLDGVVGQKDLGVYDLLRED